MYCSAKFEMYGTPEQEENRLSRQLHSRQECYGESLMHRHLGFPAVRPSGRNPEWKSVSPARCARPSRSVTPADDGRLDSA